MAGTETSWPRDSFDAGVLELMESSRDRQNNLQQRTARDLIWTSHHTFQGWTCSQCEWNYPLPTLLNDPEARTAYDRLAAGKFREHKCADHLRRLGGADTESFTPRIRKLVSQGFKPKDAVGFATFGGEKDHWNRSQRDRLPNLAAKLQTVFSGHHDVQQKQGGPLTLRVGDDNIARRIKPHVEIGALQMMAHQAGNIRVVFDDEDGWLHGHYCSREM